MAFTNFYIQSGGADANAGTSTANAADVTQTNGSWDITADTFIATAATPFSAVTTSDWASIYVDGGTVAVYVAQVVSINAGGLSITLSTTAKYGTKPSASATTRSCKVNGAWATEQPLAAGGLASTTVPASTKVNVKAATYTITAARVISLAGTAIAPVWISGYNTTPGDLDSDTTNALAKPVLALNATFSITASGAYQLWSGFSITGSRTGTLFSISSTPGRVARIRVENTSSNAGAIAFTLSSASVTVAYSWFKTPSTATSTGVVLVSGAGNFVGCVADTGGLAGFNTGANSATFINCVSLGGVNGILGSTASLRIIGCTTYNPSGDGIKWSGTPGTASYVSSCLLSNCGGFGINNASGTNTDNVFRACNDFYSCTSGNENGFGDSVALFGQTDGSAVVTSSTDMTPVFGSNARNNGFPGMFENQTYLSYLDIGAVDHIDPSSSGGGGAAIFGG